MQSRQVRRPWTAEQEGTRSRLIEGRGNRQKKEGLLSSLSTQTAEALSESAKDSLLIPQKAAADNLLPKAMDHFYLRDARLDLPSNYKEVLHRLEAGLQESMNETGVKEEMKTENAAGTKAVKDLETEARQMANQIYKEQLAMLSDDQISKSGYFQLFLKEGGQTQPVKFYFKENTSGTGQGGGKTDKKSYFIFFSMQLSQIGYFEVNILDLNKKLDVTFFSDNSEVRKVFESKSRELLEKLEENESLSVSLKPANPQKKKEEPVLLDLKPMSGKSGSVDILI